jgi:RHS repeat-associated protein
VVRARADHLGSITALTSSTGGVVERFSYDPWGKRRQATTSPWLAILPGSHLIPASLANLTRGFTGHEHLDRVGLIHMNGRIYDPELGRFLSADPILQFPASTQGLDRYAYVLNNPVSLSDPSGHLVFGLAAALIGVKLAASGKFALAALTAAIGGYLDTGSLKAGIFSAISAGFSFGVGAIGEVLKASFSSAFQLAAVAVLHGLTQGILAVAQGGKFGPGFLSAAASSAFGPKGSGAGLSDGKRLVRILQSAAVGGTASRIGGGKFANGAYTAAFLATAVAAADYYKSKVGYDADIRPGTKHSEGVDGNCCSYEPDPEGRPPGPKTDVSGVNRDHKGHWLHPRNALKQGGIVGRFVNFVLPFGKATSHLHDTWLNNNPDLSNAGTMLPAYGISVAAVPGVAFRGWESSPIVWHAISLPYRPRDDD